MSDYLCISATFLDPRFHGKADGSETEWPPSPLRLFQSIVAANANRLGSDDDLESALHWLEQQPPPIIVAPRFEGSAPYCLSVPNNAMDLVGKSWNRGNYFGTGDSNPATHRTMKTIRPVRMIDGDTVSYLWRLVGPASRGSVGDAIIRAARRIVALGWGVDLVVGHAYRTNSDQLHELQGERWKPTTAVTSNPLRFPIQGTLDALKQRHESFLDRIADVGFVPVDPLSQFHITSYRRASDPLIRPTVVFELRRENGEFFHYAQRRFIHVAGMVRHLAIQLMKQVPPTGVDEGWVERFVAGHRDQATNEHRQCSYLPLPSIGHRYADQGVRRVMIVAPIGNEAWLEHLARRLEGRQLKSENGNEFGQQGSPTLVRVFRDTVARKYTAAANFWASVTPVILPGHDDHKSAKTHKLIEAALAQSGVEQPCTFEWSAFSRFPKSLSAHKYNRHKKPSGYIRPNYLETQTAVHLTLQFDEEAKVDGPLVIGAGRHCGFGLMAGIDE